MRNAIAILGLALSVFFVAACGDDTESTLAQAPNVASDTASSATQVSPTVQCINDQPQVSSGADSTDPRERAIQDQLLAFLASDGAAELRRDGVCINSMGAAADLSSLEFYADVRVEPGSPLTTAEIAARLNFPFDVRVSEDTYRQSD